MTRIHQLEKDLNGDFAMAPWKDGIFSLDVNRENEEMEERRRLQGEGKKLGSCGVGILWE